MSELSHTVDFDFDQIESSTARLCQHGLTHHDSADEVGGSMWPDRSWTPITRDVGNSFALRDHSAVLRPSPLWREDSVIPVDGESDDLMPSAFQCDADEILAQAQAISLGHQIDDFVNLDEHASDWVKSHH